jgi:hypothetical protein
MTMARGGHHARISDGHETTPRYGETKRSTVSRSQETTTRGPQKSAALATSCRSTPCERRTYCNLQRTSRPKRRSTLRQRSPPPPLSRVGQVPKRDTWHSDRSRRCPPTATRHHNLCNAQVPQHRQFDRREPDIANYEHPWDRRGCLEPSRGQICRRRPNDPRRPPTGH